MLQWQRLFLKTVSMATKKTKKVKILLPVAGKYNLSASIGETVSYPAALADELVEDNYAEFVK